MTTTSITTAEAKDQFIELVNRAAHDKERIVLMRREKPVAAIISIEDFKLLESIQNKGDLEEAAEALKEARAQGSISLDELKADIG